MKCPMCRCYRAGHIEFMDFLNWLSEQPEYLEITNRFQKRSLKEGEEG